jgi:Uma2 family endonuclease
MIAKASRFYYTPEEYLRMEENSEEKHEYHEGEIYLMSGAKPRHNLVSFNISTRIGLGIEDKDCTGYTSDQLISNPKQEFFYYPDISVVCGEPELLPERDYVITNPILIVEVMSPSTARFDKGDKFDKYRTIPSLQSYVLIEQSKIQILNYRRVNDTDWYLEELNDISQTLKIPALDLEILLTRIYSKVNFNTDE